MVGREGAKKKTIRYTGPEINLIEISSPLKDNYMHTQTHTQRQTHRDIKMKKVQRSLRACP